MTDGSTYTHWSTSPRSVVRLTRDVNNNPLWRPGSEGEDQLEDETGRLGRFRRRFESADDVVDFSTFDESIPAQPKSEKTK
jgi:ribosomal protein L31